MNKTNHITFSETEEMAQRSNLQIELLKGIREEPKLLGEQLEHVSSQLEENRSKMTDLITEQASASFVLERVPRKRNGVARNDEG